MAATLSVKHDDIYREVRSFLLSLFGLPADNVIRGYSNNVPLPNGDFILMNIIHENALSTTIHDYSVDDGDAEVMQMVEVSIQLDFYFIATIRNSCNSSTKHQNMRIAGWSRRHLITIP